MQTIVITGGPCAGKTTALAYLEVELTRRGWTLVLVPECATSLIGGGIAPWTGTRLIFQTAVFELQLGEENAFFHAAEKMPGKVLVVCDRGLMDGKGYLSDAEFENVLAEHGYTEEEAFARYGAVFHLESAAKGTQGAYTLENNATRKEDPEEATRVDNRILEAWEGHSHRCVIGNEERFEQKAQHLLAEVLAYLEQAEALSGAKASVS